MENKVYSASSFSGPRKYNSDGTVNIYCPRCSRFICSVGEQNRFFTADCAVCLAADRGETLTQDQIDMMQLVRLPDGKQLPKLVISPAVLPDPMVGTDAEMGRTSYFFRAITKLKAVAKAAGRRVDTESKKLAKTKRRQPVLEGGVMINVRVNEDYKDKK